MEEAFEAQVNVEDGTDSTEIYYRPDPRSVALGSLVNRFTFHGRPYDAETGLYYFRNRYFDPEMGRFITPDPLGYVDGPSMYQFSKYGPFTFSDPLGLRALEPFDKNVIRNLKTRQGELIAEYTEAGTYKGEVIDQVQFEIELEKLNMARVSFIEAVAEADPGQRIIEGWRTTSRGFRVYHIPIFWPEPPWEEVERRVRVARAIFFVTQDVPLLLCPVAGVSPFPMQSQQATMARTGAKPRNPWNRFQWENKGRFSSSTEALKAYRELQAREGNVPRGTAGAVKRTVSISQRNLQKGFTKHGADFGLSGNWNPGKAAEFGQAIRQHVSSPGVRVIEGSYRGNPVTHFVDPKTGLNVIVNPAGNYVSGWRLGAEQLEGVLSSGRLF
ncbi:MAG: hypothetical protein GY835_11575 [bacterium]|nr:hypothetical protein [bacterium]